MSNKQTIILRDFIVEDIDLNIRYLNNSSVTKYLTSRIPQPYTQEDGKWWIETGSKSGINKAIESDGIYIGTIGVTVGEYESNRTGEIGYWIAEEYWGNGIATEAVKIMTQNIFSTTEIARLFAPVFSPNKVSMRVLEKCGYTLEAIHHRAVFKNDEFMDEHVFVKFRS